ncbi:MAG: kelch repeat-containing protein, partial [Terracidiphilus sp.]
MLLCLFAFTGIPLSAGAQTSAVNEWTWMGGSSTLNCIDNSCAQPGPGVTLEIPAPGVYGTLGTPAAGNIPGGRYEATSWTDRSGNLWLFGGQGSDANGNIGYLNDLWKFNPATNQWAWMDGSSTLLVITNGVFGQPGVYGTLATPAAENTPGGRYEATSWTDSSGNLWLFGGYGFDANGNYNYLNDLWKFNPVTNEWAWMGGNSIADDNSGVYGSLGTPAAGNIPGGRYEATSWTDR